MRKFASWLRKIAYRVVKTNGYEQEVSLQNFNQFNGSTVHGVVFVLFMLLIVLENLQHV